MTQEELNYIKDSFSQILDDIGGNPDWYDAAKAVASDLGTMEKQLEERITKLPSNLDEAKEVGWDAYYNSDKFPSNPCAQSGYKTGFKAGAEWMAKQGETVEGYITDEIAYNGIAVILDNEEQFKPGDEVIVQIRKK